MSSVDDLNGKKRAILIAAEKCFAAQSYEGVSIRDIAHEAAVPVALVGYYFGAKNELYHAIFEYHSSYLAERLDKLRHARQQARNDSMLDAVIAAFILPTLQLNQHPEGKYFCRMVMRGAIDQHEASERIYQDFYEPMAKEFIAALRDALPDASADSICWSYQFTLGALLHHVVDTSLPRLAGTPYADKLNLNAAPYLLKFISSGIRATIDTGVAEEN